MQSSKTKTRSVFSKATSEAVKGHKWGGQRPQMRRSKTTNDKSSSGAFVDFNEQMPIPKGDKRIIVEDVVEVDNITL